MPRSRQPPVPDRVPAAADLGYVLAVLEHRITLLPDPQARPPFRHAREVRHFHATKVVEVAVVVGVVADSVSLAAYLAGNVVEVRQESLPLGRNARAGLGGVALGHAGQEQRFAGLEPGWRQVGVDSLVHLDGLHERDTFQGALLANRLGRTPELIAKSASKGLVGTVPGI